MQCLNQSGLIDDRSAADIDQGAIWPQCLQDLGIHDFMGGGAAGCDANERVAAACHFSKVVKVPIGHIFFRARVINNRCLPRRELVGNGLANAAKSQNPHGLFVHRAGQRGVALGAPIARADVGIVTQQLAIAGQQEQERRGGDLLVQHIWRMSNKDIAAHRFGNVNRVITDTVPADDFEIAERGHELRVHAIMTICDDMSDGLGIKVVQLVDRECRF